MPVRDSTDRPRETRDAFDWRGWLALAWAGWFGVLYVRMVLDERAPGVFAAIGRLIGR